MSEEDNKPVAWSEAEIPALSLLPGFKRSVFPEPPPNPFAFADGDVAGPLPSYQSSEPSVNLLFARARAALWKRLAKTLFHEGTEQWEVRNRKLQEENERLDDEVVSLTSDYNALTDKFKALEEAYAHLLAEQRSSRDSDSSYVESLRIGLDNQRAAYEHKTLVNADLQRKLEAAESKVTAMEASTMQLQLMIRDENERMSRDIIATTKDLIGRLISFIASGAPELVNRKPSKAAPAKPKATRWPGTHARMREQVREKFKDSPARKAAPKNAKKASKLKSAKKKSRM